MREVVFISWHGMGAFVLRGMHDWSFDLVWNWDSIARLLL